ncbi:alcohol acetyltransferase [Tessaracoccus terricola]
MTEQAAGAGPPERNWVRLDNAANIFLAARNEVDTKVFRLAADLDEPVDPGLLQQALDSVYAQYPLFRAVLRHGIFWYYLQQSTLHPRVAEDVLPSVTHIYRPDSRELLFRVLHRGRRVSLEVFHALTDGTGALWFFEDLLTVYVGLRHPEGFAAATPAGAVKQELTVDAFTHWFRAKRGRASFADEAAAAVESAPLPKEEAPQTAAERPRHTPGRRVVRVHGNRTPDLRSRVVELSMPVAEVLALARAEGVSLTVYLTALFFQSVRQVRSARTREDTMTMSVPVNLRQFFPTASGRNFFATTRLEHTHDTEGATPIGEVCRNLAEQFGRQLTKQGLTAKMHRLVAFERHPLLRVFPRPLKDLVLAVVNWFNNRGITLAISNLGRVDLPQPTAQHVRGLAFHVSAARPQLCAISSGARLTLTLTSPFVETDYHAALVQHLTRHGVEVGVDATRVTAEEIEEAGVSGQ